MSDPTDLLPCPFCGAPGEYEYDADASEEAAIVCQGCGARVGGVYPESPCADADTPSALVMLTAGWNQRAVAPAGAPDVSALIEERDRLRERNHFHADLWLESAAEAGYYASILWDIVGGPPFRTDAEDAEARRVLAHGREFEVAARARIALAELMRAAAPRDAP